MDTRMRTFEEVTPKSPHKWNRAAKVAAILQIKDQQIHNHPVYKEPEPTWIEWLRFLTYDK